ncbi:unnamed protein product, partial [Polarella glacialis]
MKMEEGVAAPVLNVAPLMSDEKASYAWRQLLCTLLGGGRIVPGMPVKAYVFQGAVWASPPLLSAGISIGLSSKPAWVRFAVAGAAGLCFSGMLDVGRWLVCRSRREAASSSKVAWFVDYDEVDYTNLFSPSALGVLLPAKRSNLHLLSCMVL